MAKPATLIGAFFTIAAFMAFVRHGPDSDTGVNCVLSGGPLDCVGSAVQLVNQSNIIHERAFEAGVATSTVGVASLAAYSIFKLAKAARRFPQELQRKRAELDALTLGSARQAYGELLDLQKANPQFSAALFQKALDDSYSRILILPSLDLFNFKEFSNKFLCTVKRRSAEQFMRLARRETGVGSSSDEVPQLFGDIIAKTIGDVYEQSRKHANLYDPNQVQLSYKRNFDALIASDKEPSRRYSGRVTRDPTDAAAPR